MRQHQMSERVWRTC